MGLIIPGPPRPIERLMIFVDGGYIRRVYRNLFGVDDIDFGNLLKGMLGFYRSAPSNPFDPNLIRAYYYDGKITDEKDPEYAKEKEYFSTVTRHFFWTLRLGDRVKKADGRYRQKGVDILMAIDALTKAYTNQYDTALFFVGDRDFIPLIDAVKNAGKKTLGFYYGTEKPGGKVNSVVPVELGKIFDSRIVLLREVLETWRIKD